MLSGSRVAVESSSQRWVCLQLGVSTVTPWNGEITHSGQAAASVSPGERLNLEFLFCFWEAVAEKLLSGVSTEDS